MGRYCKMPCRVDSRQVDLFGQMRLSALLGDLQEAAVKATCEMDMGAPRLMEKYHAFWVVNRWQVRLDRPLRWEEAFAIRTWHRGGESGSVYRDFDILRDGQAIGSAVSLWVMVDPDSHRLVPARGCPEFRGTDGGELNRTERLRRVDLPERFDSRVLREMHYSDTDMNGHINNVRYADFLCDAIHLEELGRGKFVSGFQVCFLSECRAGETIAIDCALRADGCCARGMGPDGKERFECALTLSPLP